MKEIFKANDVRGKYPSQLDGRIVRAIGKALARRFGAGSTLVIGRDVRLSSPTLYRALKNSLKVKALKLKVIDSGMITTPMLYFLVNHFRADGGIMVTASHNPKEYNGLKVVGRGARPIGGKEIGELVIRN